jgi:oligoendopeptidase F
MTEATLKPHSEIAPEYTWNAESVYESPAAWAAEAEQLPPQIQAIEQYRGRLAEGPDTLLEAIGAIEQLMLRMGKLLVYATMEHSVDTTNQEATSRFGQSRALIGQAAGAVGFLDPGLLEIGRETLNAWMQQNPRLAIYAHYIDDLFRRQAHVRSAEVEELLGMLADPFSGVRQTYSMLSSADLTFRPAVSSEGEEKPVNQGTLDTHLISNDREIRRTAWESYRDGYLAFKNTLASNLSNSIKQNVFSTRARRYNSTLEAALFGPNIPPGVFTSLLDTFKRNLPTWHRYWAVRRRALGVEQLHEYDIWTPLTSYKPHVPYEQAVDWISAGLAPLGDDYVNALRRGCLEDRWVDVYPNTGKTDGAFSSGWQGTHPFILMSYDDSLFSLSTLAHELGHSMHSYLSWQTQPFIYSRYSLFVAEVASNFNQAMVRAHLLAEKREPEFQLAVIEEAMSNFHRYFFIMPTLARFELEAHQRAERGQGLTADGLIALMTDLFSEAYGGEMRVDPQRTGITWATFGHMYSDYYVYQYATGISGAHALSQRILAGEAGAAEAYLNFLKAGGSVYGLDALKGAGVDLSKPEPVEAAFAALAGMVDRLEEMFPSKNGAENGSSAR